MKVIFKNGYLEDQKVDVIVNAADAGIWFGDGVDGALRCRGGWDYIRACQRVSAKHSPIPTGEFRFMRNKGRLKCKFVVHAVSPDWTTIEPYWMMYGMVRKLLKKGEKMRMRSLAIPVLGSGAFSLRINKCYAAINRAAKKTPGKMIVLIVHPDYKPDGRRTKMVIKKKLKRVMKIDFSIPFFS
jgi:O-acetyl-ADP-ribose deacetylase (regulator of RNase III)